MRTARKHVDLFLDDELVERLEREAADRRVSLSEVVQSFLARDLGPVEPAAGAVDRLREIRHRLGPMPDSAPLIREARDTGW